VTRFDLQSAPTFPRLDEAPANAELCPGATTWRQCIRNEANESGGLVLVADEGVDTRVVVPDELQDNDTCRAALDAAMAAADRTLRFDGVAVDCTYTYSDEDGQSRTGGFRYTPGTTNTFETFGNINVRGLNVRFERGTSYTTGGTNTNAMFSVESIPLGDNADAPQAGGDILVNSSFVPVAPSRFPDEVLALLAERMLTVNGGNQTTVTAPVYAGDMFRIRANSVLAGQVIADAFCSMGSPNSLDCNNAGAPPQIIYSSSSGNRPDSYSAAATPGGTPTFRLLGYEQR
jgi:hypothetical protein